MSSKNDWQLKGLWISVLLYCIIYTYIVIVEQKRSAAVKITQTGRSTKGQNMRNYK